MHNSSSSYVFLSVMSSFARYLCCVGLIYLLQGCTTLGVELIDSSNSRSSKAMQPQPKRQLMKPNSTMPCLVWLLI